MSSYTKRKIAFRTCALVMALLAVLTITLKTLDKARDKAEEADIKQYTICGERESQILGRGD